MGRSKVDNGEKLPRLSRYGRSNRVGLQLLPLEVHLLTFSGLMNWVMRRSSPRQIRQIPSSIRVDGRLDLMEAA